MNHVHLQWPGLFDFTGGALLGLLLSWRFLRVLHGLVTSLELQHKREHEKIAGERNNTVEFLMTTRKKTSSKQSYFKEFHDTLKARGVIDDETKHYHGKRGGTMAGLGHNKMSERETRDMMSIEIQIETGYIRPSHDLGGRAPPKRSVQGVSISSPIATHGQTKGGCAIEQAMMEAMQESHDTLKERLNKERQLRATAESMYVEIYKHIERHMDDLKVCSSRHELN